MLLIGAPQLFSGGDLLEIINNRQDLELFKEMIKCGGGEKILTATSESFILNKVLPVIIFAPSDNAIQKIGYTKEIINTIARDDGYVKDQPDKYSYRLRNFICQHIMLKAQEKKEALKSEYERVYGTPVRIEQGTIKTSSGQTASIIVPNLEATNGIIHIIDTVLEP